MDGCATQKPLVVSPDVFCTPAMRRYEGGGREEGKEGREGVEDGGAGRFSSKKLGLVHQSTSPPTGGSILAVRDPNVRRTATGTGSVKRVSFKDVPPMSPSGASGPEVGSARERSQALSQPQPPQELRRDGVASPGPWTELMEDLAPEESFTHYLNPLADGEDDREAESLEGFAEVQQSPMSQLSRAVDTATSRGVAFHMQTPEAVQVLHKISLHTKGGLDRGSLDRYMRTGPKKLSPEPGMILLGGEKEGDAAHGGGDAGVDGVDVMAALESSEDENAVDDRAAVKLTRNEKLILASPIGRGRVAANVDEATDLDEVPPTFDPGHRFKTSGRVTSPVHFSLLGDSPDSYAENAGVEGARGSGSNGRSFSFGMGGGADEDAEATAQFLDTHPGLNEECQEESVDQPNPFGEMLGKLKEDPERLQSPVVRAIIEDAVPEGSLVGSPESPANCTPMNLISTSAAASLQGFGRLNASNVWKEVDGMRVAGSGGWEARQLDEARDILSEASSLDEWMSQRGIKHLSTPTRSDLQKMWDALANIRETTEAYADATRENAQLREQLWETREAELDARADLEEALEVVRIEQERSRDAASKMAELAMSMHQQFAILEGERRQLQFDLDEARKMLDASAGEGVANVMQEIDGLKAELERLRVAELAARADAMDVREESRALQNQVKFLEDSAAAEPSTVTEGAGADAAAVIREAALGDAAEVFDAALDAVDVVDVVDELEQSFHQDLSAAEGDVQCKVEFFERLQLDARCGIKMNEPVGPALSTDKCIVSPLDDSISPSCPHTGIRAPRTTPVDADEMTTPYRIHVETMSQFRDAWKAPAGKLAEEAIDPERASTDSGDSASDASDYEVEDIVVSPIDVEDLTRANLRQTVMQRIAAVKSDLASAKSRLGHAQSGFRGRAAAKAPAAVPTALDVIAEEADMEDKGAGDSPTPAFASTDVDHANDDEDVHAFEPANELADEPADEESDVVDAEGGPTPTSQSHRSIFARRLDAMSTPLPLRKAAFTPKSAMSSLKSTARLSPRFSSTSSSSTPLPPSYLQRTVVSRPAPRTRRFGIGREPSAEEDREFRRRAAALNIHVSPYMKRSTGRRQMALN